MSCKHGCEDSTGGFCDICGEELVGECLGCHREVAHDIIAGPSESAPGNGHRPDRIAQVEIDYEGCLLDQ